ncbi:SRPBCC family protein [Pseudooceanicola sp. 502str34]|uniref:SRPBCC family protein n=1 Tax=Maritimibacter alkaliphilus TaxID=404236 RepID=UPI001C96639B|nr:SRPBCC family protein [Maritimibacter alkaliphilus]MBY6091281.1 SRPBCC family protein [Maritimibacter alkaliphilus]
MKLTVKEDIEAPIEYVFDRCADFETFERGVLRRGAKIERKGGATEIAPGLTWAVSAEFRGRTRNFDVTLKEYDRPNRLEFLAESDSFGAETVLEFVALAPGRTRISCSFEVKPKTLSARLMVQSVKMAKSNLTKRLSLRLADFGEEIAASYRATTPSA